ncbi:hypothetical protein BO221_06945 [Archangium sp. Cb G35]|uniref:DUF2378 family protein n=1 Tax=Archangium sp. Cb G35 TaxID=1920190 RepID=UPI0009368805|nr:DUF2378 family protein [Archangium sp. Cb G35]OJT25603.1 hypothetical protein BO221_06945 [Archangium sp. Cb G35]
MPETPLVFNHTVQGLFSRSFPDGVPAGLKAQLREAGVDLDKPLLPAYPTPVWSRCIDLGARAAFPDEPRREVAWRRMGERMIDGYQDSMIGRAMFGMLQVLGPRRTLQRAQKNFRTGNNYSEVRVSDVSPTEMELWFNETDDVLRHFTVGLVLAGMRAGGAEEPQVRLHEVDAKGFTLRASWKPK